MTLNARMTPNDPRLYNPNRDVAHNFDQVMMEVAKRCEGGTWDVLVKLAKDHGVTEEQLGQACRAMCIFVAHQPEKGETMGQCMVKSGFLDCPDIARVIVAAYMGTITLGIHWAGVREATLGGVGPASSYKGLRWHGLMCTKLMKMPRWKRKLYTFWRRVRAAWRTFWQKEEYGQ